MNVIGLTLAAMVLAGSAAVADVTENCANTVNAYAHARDAAGGEAFGALFTQDAVMETPSGTARGRDQIVAAMQVRAAAGVTRHLVTSVHIRPEGKGRASGKSYSLIFASPQDKAFRRSDMVAIAQYNDDFAISGGRCLFQKRRLTVLPFMDAP